MKEKLHPSSTPNVRIINVPLLYLFYLLDFHALFYISQKNGTAIIVLPLCVMGVREGDELSHFSECL